MKNNPVFSLLFLNNLPVATDNDQCVAIDQKHSLSIPSFLTTTEEPEFGASRQYQNQLREFYLAVSDLSRDDFRKRLMRNVHSGKLAPNIYGYSEMMIAQVVMEISASAQSDITERLIDYKPARLVEFSGKYKGVDAFYSLAFIQGREKYYRIMAWTLSSAEYCHKSQMSRIIHSFREV